MLNHLASLAAAGLILLGFLGACYSPPEFPDGVRCTVPERLCPKSQQCAADNRCYAKESELNSDARLSGLALSVGRLVPPFNSETMSYSVEQSRQTSDVVVTATAFEPGHVVISVASQELDSAEPSNPIALDVGQNALEVSVIASTGAQIIYQIDAQRRECDSHADCPSDVCEPQSGLCVKEAEVIYLNAGAGADSIGCGAIGAPCQTINGTDGGLAKITATRKTLRLRGATVFAESVSIDAGQEVVFAGPATVNPPLDNQPVFNVENESIVSLREITATGAKGNVNADGVRCDSSTVNVERSTVSNNDATGIEASNCTLNVERSTISNNDATGIEASNCTLNVSRSTVSQNARGGIDVDESSFIIENNFVIGNGNATVLFGGAQIANGAGLSPQTLQNNTIANNTALEAGGVGGLDCTTGSPLTATGNIISPIVGNSASVSGNCAHEYSNIENAPSGTGNIDADPLFVNVGGGDFHIQPTSSCRNAADPAATLAIDFDGDPRPQGERHDIGADEVRE